MVGDECWDVVRQPCPEEFEERPCMDGSDCQPIGGKLLVVAPPARGCSGAAQVEEVAVVQLVAATVSHVAHLLAEEGDQFQAVEAALLLGLAQGAGGGSFTVLNGAGRHLETGPRRVGVAEDQQAFAERVAVGDVRERLAFTGNGSRV